MSGAGTAIPGAYVAAPGDEQISWITDTGRTEPAIVSTSGQASRLTGECNEMVYVSVQCYMDACQAGTMPKMRAATPWVAVARDRVTYMPVTRGGGRGTVRDRAAHDDEMADGPLVMEHTIRRLP